MNKENCLLIIPGIPYPPTDGHKLKIYNLILILKEKFDLHLITISREDLNQEQTLFLEKNSVTAKHFKLGFFLITIALIKSVFSKIPFQVSMFTYNHVNKYLRNYTVDCKYVILNLVRTGGYLPLLKNKKVVFDIVDLLSSSYKKSEKTTSSKLFKIIYRIEGGRLHNYERNIVRNADLTICVNENEARNLKEFGNVKWLPNGVNKSLFTYNKVDTGLFNSIAFFGSMFYQPNIDAVIWFDRYVIDSLDPTINLFIIGARPSSAILEIAKKRKNVIVTGFLEDPYEILNSCFAIVAPMQNGGGIQNKILETMGMGKLNIITSYAANPIVGGVNDEHFLVEDDPVFMASKINAVFKNPHSFEHIGINAKKLILSRYTWESYRKQFFDAIDKL